jgi:hypothetical protein
MLAAICRAIHFTGGVLAGESPTMQNDESN